jgi:uncharacterized membrane protein YeaQ/YmgE (transglycosylase-associated protein family)
MPEAGQIITWVVIGALAGAAAGSLIRRKLYFYEIIVAGLLGAVVGGFLIKATGLNLPDQKITLSIADLLTAFIGAVIVIGYAEIAISMRRRRDR